MRIFDRVYGECEISEPVIVELISGSTIQRLKEIDQSGYFEGFFPGISYSRFEHSVGAYLLLHKYNAPLEEQITGLIHDVSHTAFSHCIDYVFGSGERQDFQDNVFDEFVRKSEIPGILSKYDLDCEYILNDANFPLKEKKLPDLCADRIDYSLRTARVRDDFSSDDILEILAHLTTKNSNWIFTEEKYARKYAELFKFVNTKYFAGLESAAMLQSVGDYLHHALTRSYIAESDIFTTDRQVLEKIAPYHLTDEKLLHLFNRMSNKVAYSNDPSDYEKKVVCKGRIVDPLFDDKGTAKKLSVADAQWRTILAQELKPKEYFLRFEH